MAVTTRELRVETSTVCNYRCVMCAHATLARRREVMPDALFARIIEMAGAELPQLELCTVSGFGEFAADPRWQHKLELARARFPRVHVVTNLSLVRDDALEALASLATEVRVSVYAVDGETYRRVHRPPESVSYRIIEARIVRLAELRRRTGLTLGLTCCELDENRAQVPRWIERWEGVADHLEVWRPHNWVDGRRYRSIAGERIASCGRPASGPLQVQVDGTMNVCCFDFDGKMVIGDLGRQTFTEILEGPELRRVRGLHAAGRADELALCAVCDQREPPSRKQAHLLHCSRSPAPDRILRTSSGMERLPDPGPKKR
jgi:hypothetical protein